MGYAYMAIDKVKTLNHLNGKMKHNFRIIDVSNANPSLKDGNEELIKMKESSYVNGKRSNKGCLEKKRPVAIPASRFTFYMLPEHPLTKAYNTQGLQNDYENL
jgi:hypothetical protein